MKILLKSMLFVITIAMATSCTDDPKIAPYNQVAYSDGFDSWDNWTKFNVIGTETWQLSTIYGNPTNCATISGYTGGNHENEDWLISPEFDLTGMTGAMVAFETACSSFAGNSLGILISKNYVDGQNPNDATWTDLSASATLATATSTANDYIWTKSGGIDITAFAGQHVRIAFKYTSTTSASKTWEVDNLKIIKVE